MRLSFSIVLLVFSIIIIGDMFSLYVIYDYKNTLLGESSNDAVKRNILMMNKIDSYTTDRIVDAINLANNISIESTANLSNTQFSAMADPEHYIDKIDAEWISAPPQEITPFMKTLIDNQESKMLRKISESIDSLYGGNVYGEIFITNAYGANIAETDKTSDYRQNDENWWKEAKKDGIDIGQIEFDNSSKNISFAIAKRIDDENGNFLGVIKEVVNLDLLIKIIKTQMTTNTDIVPSEYEIVDQSGHILFSTDPSEKTYGYNHEVGFIENMKKESGYFTYKYPDSDETYLVVYTHSKTRNIDSGFDWILITQYKYSDILTPVTNTITYTLIVMILLVIGISLFTFIAADRIASPIILIQNAMKNYSNGKVIELKSSGPNEIESLIKIFKQMIKAEEDSKIKIKKSEYMYKSLFEQNPDPVRIATLDLKTLEVNQQFLDKFGYTRDEIIGKSVFVNMETQRDATDILLENLRNGKRVENIEMVYHKKDGTKIPALVSLSLNLDQDGKPIGHIAVIKDITEIYETRKKIREKEEEVLEQYLKLREIDGLKDEFAAMMSHELTTPLFPIKFHAAMLKDVKVFGSMNKDQIESVNAIYENSLQLEKLINSILFAQKLELHQIKFAKTDFKIDEFMSEVEKDVKPMMKDKSVKLENVTKDNNVIKSDPERLKQVFTNLIENSVSFVSEKTGRIEICAETDGDKVKFYVKDNGIGIEKDKQENLFKKFYQTDTSARRKHGGGGIGLSICKGIIEGLGGKIWLESTKGLGTIVYFTIPRGVTT